MTERRTITIKVSLSVIYIREYGGMQNALETIYKRVSNYLAHNPMPTYTRWWEDVQVPPKRQPVSVLHEVADFVEKLGDGDTILGARIMLELDKNRLVREWQIIPVPTEAEANLSVQQAA